VSASEILAANERVENLRSTSLNLIFDSFENTEAILIRRVFRTTVIGILPSFVDVLFQQEQPCEPAETSGVQGGRNLLHVGAKVYWFNKRTVSSP